MNARWLRRVAVLIALLLPLAAEALEDLQNRAPMGVLPADYQPWPREVKNGAITYRIYEPQTESWNGSDLRFRAAVAVTADGGTRYGIVFGRARTWVEIGTGLVKLESIQLERVDFPTAKDEGSAYLPDLQRGASSTWVVRREQLDPAQAIEQRVPVRNDPPRIFVSYSPALLVLIDGQPVLRKVPDLSFERVINTPVLLLKDSRTGHFYLHAFDGWLTARELIGPWQTASGDNSALDRAKESIAASGSVDLLNSGEGRPSLRAGAPPVIYVSTTPAELIVLTGEPQFEPITGTQLLWVKNTAAPLLLDTGSDQYYAVVSGRWFRAPTLNGPWSFAPPDQLPRDLALIPDGHALAPMRAAVPGTPQAREAVIANSVPQTATVRRSEARFEPTIDGEPQLRSIEGTALQYVSNSPTPIIRVDANSWYAVDRGVWFTAQGLEGPWQVATWVPQAIYSIPSSSPLHYVTYVKVYGGTPDDVYTGYTPGYLGAVVAPAGTVVYGTGAYVSPWIGNAWYGAPWTYGLGWSVGVGTFWPTWNPWYSPWWGPAWGGWWRPPYWGWGGGGWGPRPGWGAWPGWGPRPGWGGWRPPIYYPPIARPPVAFPPGVRPPGAFPPGGFPPGARPPGTLPPPGAGPGLPPAGRPNPGSPNGPGWAGTRSTNGPGWSGTSSGNGPGWANGPGTTMRAGPAPRAIDAPGVPQAFSNLPQTGAGMGARTINQGAGIPVSPGAGAAQNFRGSGQPTPLQASPYTNRGPTGGFPSPTGGITGPRTAPTYVPPAAATPGIPQTYRSAPAPNTNLYSRPPAGAQFPQGGFPQVSPGGGAVPRGYGGMSAPSGQGMAPRGGGPTPGLGGPVGGFQGGPPSGVGAPAGGFRGAPQAPRGPGWGGGGNR